MSLCQKNGQKTKAYITFEKEKEKEKDIYINIYKRIVRLREDVY
jgi:hypothetical protein